MQSFYNSFTFIISFMIIVLIFNSIFGAKSTEWFLLLVLLSMIVVNNDKFGSIFAGIGNAVKEN